MAAAPAASSSATVRSTLTAAPKPVSASTISGMLTRRAMYAVCWANSVSVNSPISGSANAPAENAAPDKYTAS